MRVSRSGSVVAAIYAVLAVGCVVAGYSLTDPKGSTVLMQVPVVPVLALLGAFGLLERLANTPLVVFYGFSITAVAVGLYGACWLFGALGFRTKLVIGVCMLGVMSILTLWPLRR